MVKGVSEYNMEYHNSYLATAHSQMGFWNKNVAIY